KNERSYKNNLTKPNIEGMSLGAVIALIIGGAGMAIPEMSMLLSIFRVRVVAAIVALVFLTAVIGGYVFNWFIH
ncbi:permease, partial [Victivallis vadensis]|uniref:permease n=1 Tax=Victivallis vadensis TaxID=172901 RepID=UPI00307DCFE5